MIRYGPAAAPRWFDSDLARFPAYLETIHAAGARQIEIVLLPGVGSEELGRVHLLENQWETAVSLAQSRGFHLDLHAPLPAEYRVAEWLNDPSRLDSELARISSLARRIADGQEEPPVLVVHAANGSPEQTRAFLDRLLNCLDSVNVATVPAIELRAPATEDDDRFDRSIDTLLNEIDAYGSDRVGICWDIAHDWESGGYLTHLTPDLIPWIRHVHLHDNRIDGFVHAPLGAGSIPWRDSVIQLARLGYNRSITLEIRYRYASEHGEPWNVLANSLKSVQTALAGE